MSTIFPKENWTRVAGLLGAAAVGLGAYGSHGLKNLSPELKRQYDTANYYHFLHTIGLALSPLSRRPQVTGSLMLLGTLLFSGTIYYNIFTEKTHLKRLTPYGGIILIVAWLSMI